MRSLLAVLVLLVWATSAHAVDPIAAVRKIDWTGAGATITHRTAICNTLSPGVTAAQIAAAWNDAACDGKVLQLTAGTFTLINGLNLIGSNNRTLRGMGPHLTILHFTGPNTQGNTGIVTNVAMSPNNIVGPDSGSFYMSTANWTAGYTRGATSITLNNTSGFTVPAVGTQLFLDQLDDTNTDTGAIWVNDIVNVTSGQGASGIGRADLRSQIQGVRVTSISGSGTGPYTVGITPGLSMPNWRSGQSPGAFWANGPPLTDVGIEDLTLDYTDQPPYSANPAGTLNLSGSTGTVTATVSGGTPFAAATSWIGIQVSAYVNSILVGAGTITGWTSTSQVTINVTTPFSATSYATGIWGVSGGAQYGLSMFNTRNCWVRNIKSLNSVRAHVNPFLSDHLTFRDSYYYGTYNAFDQSYGIETFGTFDSLTENNIFHFIAVPAMAGAASSANVVAYNYMVDMHYIQANWMQAGLYHHSTAISYHLFEGNDSNGFTLDNIHGLSHFPTAFRNRLTGFETGKTKQTSGFIGMAGHRFVNLVGNVAGTVGYHTDYEHLFPEAGDGNLSIFTVGWSGNEGGVDGNLTAWTAAGGGDPLAVSSLMRWGNWDSVTNASRFCQNSTAPCTGSEVPSALTGAASPYSNPIPADTALPFSYLYAQRPSWFSTAFGVVEWPPIGPDVTGGAVTGVGGHVHRIPARRCFEGVTRDNFNALTCYAATNCP